MTGYRITDRGYRVLGILANLGFLSLLGILGWIEGLA